MEFEDFFGAFDGGDSVAVEEPAAAEEPTAEETAEAETETGTETSTEEPAAADQEPAAEGNQEGSEEAPADSEGAQDQTFTVQIGKEEHQYSLDEMTELARKGAGYDDLQVQLDESEQARQQLQDQLDGQQDAMDVLNQIAEKSGKSVQELVKQMFINFRKSAGVSEDAAALELENAQLKKQVDEGKPAKTAEKATDESQNRAKRELAEFHRLHPGVALTEELAKKLKPDIHSGMSLANAYQKMLNDQKAAELAELERKNKAAEQNAKNRANSPGSQQDSGGRREKSNFDDFFSQFK